jgi:hypothetical protein
MTALVYAGLGDADKTVEWLERAYGERSYYIAALGTLPVFDFLREDARFKNLLERVGLPRRTPERTRPGLTKLLPMN